MKEDTIDTREFTLTEHLIELRQRLMYSIIAFLAIFCACYYFAEYIYAFLVHPLAEIYEGAEGKRLIYTSLTEAFFTYIKVAFYTALFVSFPIIASQIYIFLAPGLYKKEKLVLLPFLIATPVLFLAGAALVYYFIFPMAWSFFISFEKAALPGSLPIQLEAKIDEYLSLVIQLIFAFGLAFQLPVILNLLAKVGIVTPEGLAAKRKYAVIIILTIAAFITPPDIISQIGLALPMMLLYEFSIISCKWIKKEKEHA